MDILNDLHAALCDTLLFNHRCKVLPNWKYVVLQEQVSELVILSNLVIPFLKFILLQDTLVVVILSPLLLEANAFFIKNLAKGQEAGLGSFCVYPQESESNFS